MVQFMSSCEQVLDLIFGETDKIFGSKYMCVLVLCYLDKILIKFRISLFVWQLVYHIDLQFVFFILNI